MTGITRWISTPLGVIAGAIVTLLMAITVIDVALRKITGQGIPGSIEYNEVLLVIGVFLALGAAEASGDHIRTSVVTSRLRPVARRRVRIAAAAVGIVTVVALLVGSTMAAVDSTVEGEYRFGLVQVPLWPARWAIAVGLAVFFTEYLRTTIRDWRRDTGRPPSVDRDPPDSPLTEP